MKTKTALHRILSLTLAMVIALSLPLSALAEETTGTVDVETTAGSSEPVNVTITIESSSTDAGSTVQTTTVAEGAVTSGGMTVDYQGSGNLTTQNGTTTGTETSSYNVTGIIDDEIYTAEGGSDRTVEAEAPQVSVDVSLTEGGKETAVDADKVGSTTTGDVPTDEEDGIYDYTTQTVTQQGSATVTTTGIITEILTDADKDHDYENDLDYVRTEATPDADNDLFVETASRVDIEAVSGTLPETTEGYGYVYLGSENSSEYFAAYLFTAPQYEDEQPAYTIDGVDYYTGRADLSKEKIETSFSKIHQGFKLNGLYIDGEKVSEETHVMVWGAVQQFLLQDSKTGELITTYCADQRTYALDGYSYNIENLEDGDYYDAEAAAHIRTIAENGYWGTEEGVGSLDAMREMMRSAKDENGNALFTEEEIAILNDGVAMTATQYAIWNYSNEADNVKYLNVNYINSGDTLNKKVTSYGAMGDVPQDKQAHADLIFKLSNYLIHMEPTVIEDPTSANTVMTEENFISDLDVTVIEKAQSHENNQDTDDGNDAYVTDVRFALVVTPSTENGDDMIVKIVSNGQVLKEARIAGNAKEGEDLEMLTCDENGNYTIRNIILTEGNQEFNITLEGVQNLETGIYLYSSEIRNEEGVDTSSQTMVGMASGHHAVNVSMTVAFELDVQDQVVATEHVWRSEKTQPLPNEEPAEPVAAAYRLGVANNEPAQENIVIEEEPVPLAKAPETGDDSGIAAMFALLSGLSLVVLQLTKKRSNAR